MNGKAGKNKDTTNNCASNTLPILTAKLVQGAGLEAGDGGSGLVVSVLYGDLLKPAFERIVSSLLSLYLLSVFAFAVLLLAVSIIVCSPFFLLRFLHLCYFS